MFFARPGTIRNYFPFRNGALTCDIVDAVAGKAVNDARRIAVAAGRALRGRRRGQRRNRRSPAEGNDIAAHVISRVLGGGWGIGGAKQAFVWIITGLVGARRHDRGRTVGAIGVAEQRRAQLGLIVGLDATRARLLRGRAENIAATTTGRFQHPETKVRYERQKWGEM